MPGVFSFAKPLRECYISPDMATKKKETTPKEQGIKILCSHSQMVEVNCVRPNPANPNTHPRKQLQVLAQVIKANGFRNPIVVSNRSNLVIKGHARLAAAEILGMEKVPVDFQAYDSEAQEMEDMLADNQIAELAEMDEDLLKKAFKQLDSLGGNFDLTGYDKETVAELLEATARDIADALKTPRSKIQWGAFKVFHCAVGEQIYCMDRFNYLVSFGTMDGVPPKQAKPPNSTVFVDSGMLTLSRKIGRKALDMQPQAVEYAEKIGGDWIAMMDVPLVAPVLSSLKMDKAEGYAAHLKNAKAFAKIKTNLRKVYVMQGVTLRDYQRCCRDMKPLIKANDVVAIGSIKARANQKELIEAVTAAVHSAFPKNDIHLFGVTNPATVSKAVRYGATSADSSTAGNAVGRGECLFCRKTDQGGFVVRKQTLAEMTGEKDLSCNSKLWIALTAFSMGQVEAAMALNMVQEESAILMDAGLIQRTVDAKETLDTEIDRNIDE
jgi:hypothetical protein